MRKLRQLRHGYKRRIFVFHPHSTGIQVSGGTMGEFKISVRQLPNAGFELKSRHNNRGPPVLGQPHESVTKPEHSKRVTSKVCTFQFYCPKISRSVANFAFSIRYLRPATINPQAALGRINTYISKKRISVSTINSFNSQ